MEFKDRLKLIIDRTGDTIVAVSKVCGVAKNTLHNYLNGSQPPKAQFLELLKKHYTWINLNWLLVGDGEPFIEDKKQSSNNVLHLQHERVIREFDDKEFAIEINRALVALEKASMREFYKLGGYIKALAEQGVEQTLDRRQSQRRTVDDPDQIPNGQDRRQGKDRRAAVKKK
jgi:transcriptional regulator with XRE-family HTH domain